MTKLLEECKEVGKVHWLTDSVLDAFIFKLTDFQGGRDVSITSQEAAHLLSGKDSSLLFSSASMTQSDYYEWSNVDRVLIPHNEDGTHWILLVLLASSKVIQG